jgi:hypothetical protein
MKYWTAAGLSTERNSGFTPLYAFFLQRIQLHQVHHEYECLKREGERITNLCKGVSLVYDDGGFALGNDFKTTIRFQWYMFFF